MSNAETIAHLQFSPELVTTAYEQLEGWREGQNVRKNNKRDILLLLNPELGICVATSPLKAIIDYDSFRCSVYSSVARGKAIKGSDIDGGVVVTTKEASYDHQMAFIEELRTQGFDVYHHSEYEQAQRRSNEALRRERGRKVSKATDNLVFEAGKRYLQQIVFLTWEQLLELDEKGDLESPLHTYLTGFDID